MIGGNGGVLLVLIARVLYHRGARALQGSILPIRPGELCVLHEPDRLGDVLFAVPRATKCIDDPPNF